MGHAVGWFLVVGIPVVLLFSAFTTPERAPPPPGPRVPVVKSLRTLFANPSLRRVAFCDILCWTSVGVSSALFPFVASVLLGRADLFPILTLTFLAVSALAMPFWIWLSHAIGKHRALIVSAIFNAAIAPGVLLIQPGQIGLAFTVAAVGGFFYGAMPFLMRAMFADVAEEDQVQNGTARWGLINSIHLVTSKFGTVLAFLALIALGSWGGLETELGVDNTEGAKNMLRALYVFPPAIANIITVIVISRYKIDRKQQALNRAKLDASLAADGAPMS